MNATHHNPLSPAALRQIQEALPRRRAFRIGGWHGQQSGTIGGLRPTTFESVRCGAASLAIHGPLIGSALRPSVPRGPCGSTRLLTLDDEFHAGRVVDLLLQLNANRAVLDGATKPVEVEAFTPGPCTLLPEVMFARVVGNVADRGRRGSFTAAARITQTAAARSRTPTLFAASADTQRRREPTPG